MIMSKNLLPADLYIVVNKTTIHEQDRKLITTLYQPIIGYTAVSLYFTLVDDLDKRNLMSEDITHHHLMSTMQLKLSDIKDYWHCILHEYHLYLHKIHNQ